ncbi:MAG: DNA repair protein RecO [Eubacterium sp.]|jgi:DNA repair protein RecO (recombination protein O)|nr:DNA repair protein RecO [Eubacterium sp.]MCH4047329.1 DNA repair protein RecO [Eubacterium sp.]MCH4080425.1 DNA repair protein RecO [Eubacterium sp.]MCH4110673.1 DNA repair protein RecO [Eubacterium sp.]MCI1307223.1 DNA repair protein RecO [Eubacterium sp.]
MAGNVMVEAVVLRQFSIANGRKMVVLLTDRYGKISTGMWERTKGKKTRTEVTAPFSHIRARIIARRNSYDLLHAEIVRTHYELGEDVEKYLYASYALELTDRVVSENVPVPEIFRLLSEFLDMLCARSGKYLTLLIAYEIHLLDQMGVRAELSHCVSCGRPDELQWFSVPDGGLLCRECRKKLSEKQQERLIYRVDFGIIRTIEYFMNHNLKTFRNAALKEQTAGKIQEVVRQYLAYHLDIRKLKSEGFLEEEQKNAGRSEHGDYIRKN